MDIAVGATIAAAAKKLVMYLLGDEKGRKYLLYVVGSALFIVSIPLITLLGLFGWMAGDGGSILDQSDILANIPSEQLAQMQAVEQVCNTIATTFEEAGLEESDYKKAAAIYMGYLLGREAQEVFYDSLTGCFLNTTEEADVYDLVSRAFQVTISEADQTKFDSLYGVTPTRAGGEEEE